MHPDLLQLQVHRSQSATQQEPSTWDQVTFSVSPKALSGSLKISPTRGQAPGSPSSEHTRNGSHKESKPQLVPDAHSEWIPARGPPPPTLKLAPEPVEEPDTFEEPTTSTCPVKRKLAIILGLFNLNLTCPQKELARSKALPQSKNKFAEWLMASAGQIAGEDLKDYFLQDKHMAWSVRFIVNGKNIELKTAAAKFMCSLAWPKEIQAGLRGKIEFSGLLPDILELGRDGHLSFHRVIADSEVQTKELIAKGAGGRVHRAILDGKDVAIKICGQDYTHYMSEADFRFEVAAMSLLSHPHVLTCIGANPDSSDPFIALPLLKQSLEDVFQQKKKLSEELKTKIALQTIDAVDYLHRCKILHRDLKPSNVLLDDDYSVRICDFGVSRVQDAKRPMTMNVGTMEWTAPEVFGGDGNYSPMVDIYSFGMILYQLFANRPPYSEISKFAIPQFVMDGNRPAVPHDVDESVRELILGCVHNDPGQRPQYDSITERLNAYLKKVQPLY